MNWYLLIAITALFLAESSLFAFFQKRKGIRQLVYCLLVQRGFSSLEELIRVTDKINISARDTTKAVNYLQKYRKITADYSTHGQVYYRVDDELN